MTDATSAQGEPAQIRRVTDYLSDGLRAIVAGFGHLPGRFASARSELREQKDFEKIHKALSGLNKRQLAMLGMTREDVYTFAELCVYHPERRPALRLHELGPVMAIHAPETKAALEHFAPISAADLDETTTDETTEQEPSTDSMNAGERNTA